MESTIHIRSFYPCGILQTWVEKYCIYELSYTAQANIAPAWAKDFIILHYGDSIEAKFDDGTIMPTWCASLDGFTTNPYVWQAGINAQMKFIAVQLKPGILYHLAKCASHEFTNQSIKMEDVFMSKYSSWIIDALSSAVNDEMKIHYVELFLLQLMKNFVPKYSSSVSLIVNTITQTKGSIDLYLFRKSMNISERHFRRLFTDGIGVSPKDYSKLIRIESALKSLANNDYKNLTELGLQLGYYDQAHFIKEFKNATFISPKEVKNNNELEATLKGVFM